MTIKMGETITSELETITPEIAHQMLATNKFNRKLSQARVDWLARQIANRKWMINGEPIILDVDGNLINGQHRLHACIKANLSIQTMVTRGIERMAMRTIDTGGSRTASDWFSMNGEKNT